MLVEPQTPAVLFVLVATNDWRLLLRVATRVVGPREAEDVVQEALAKAWARHAAFVGERRDMVAWLCRCVQNTALDHVRHEKARQWTPVPLDDWRDLLEHDDTPEAIFLQKEKCQEAADWVTTLLAACSPNQRRTLWAMRANEVVRKDLASRWGEREATVKAWHDRGMRRCRALLDSGLDTSV